MSKGSKRTSRDDGMWISKQEYDRLKLETIKKDEEIMKLRAELASMKLNNENVLRMASDKQMISKGLPLEDENEKELVKITEMTNPQKFTIQKISSIAKYQNFKRKVANEAEIADKFHGYNVGDICLAFLGLKKEWHRAIIIDICDSTITVESVDEGTIFSVFKSKNLKQVSMSLNSVPPFGISCALPIHYNQGIESAISSHLDQIEQGLSYEPICHYDNVTFVELYRNGENIVDQLVELNFCKRTFVVPSGAATITKFESIMNFTVIMRDDFDKLKLIMIASKTIGAASQLPTEIKVRKIVWAKSKDGKWYRARIMRVENSEFQVYFIDQGFEEIIHELREIQDCNILSIPPLAIKCSLAGLPDNINVFLANETVVKLLNDLNNNVDILMIAPGIDCAKVDFKVSQDETACEILFCGNHVGMFFDD